MAREHAAARMALDLARVTTVLVFGAVVLGVAIGARALVWVKGRR